MVFCRVCSCENNVTFYRTKGSQFLCLDCAIETPRKVSRESFCKAFFDVEESVFARPGILREFYNDYITSTLNLKQYCEQCSTLIED